MLVMALLVLTGTVLVLLRLSSGGPPDLKKTEQGIRPVSSPESGQPSGSGKGTIAIQASPKETQQSFHPQSSDETSPAGGRFTLTAAGTVAMENEILNQSYLKDMKTYDFSDYMQLLRKEVQSDVNLVFLENIVTDDEKLKNITAPSATAGMLKDGGFNMAACAFSGAWKRKETGVLQTRENLQKAGITPLGLYDPKDGKLRIEDYGGIRTAILQYTTGLSSGDRSGADSSGAIPAGDGKRISGDIFSARNQGADLVIVLMNWGTAGKTPDKAQRNLAAQIAEAGADLIIGCGSRTPQPAEYLTGQKGQILCIWSLGTLLTAERKNNNRMAGYLFHAEFVMDADRNVRISGLQYTPLFTWMFKQEGRNHYRCLAANRPIPDGMENDQRKKMETVANITRTALQGTPLAER